MVEEGSSSLDRYIIPEALPRGFPVWLKYVPGISFRTDNEPFKRAMAGFTEKIVNLMKYEKLFESQGGPIILSQVNTFLLSASGTVVIQAFSNHTVVVLQRLVSYVVKVVQIENEYGVLDKKFGPAGYNYMTWAAEMAVGLRTGVPWIMCKQEDAPDPIYHGGTNFGRSAGGPFITTSYDYDAPLDEYGLTRQPKYGHLTELHKAIKKCEPALVSGDPTVFSLGAHQQAHVYYSQSGHCAAFLSNYNPVNSTRVMFNKMHHALPPWSISILPDCSNVVFNTAKIGVQSTRMTMLPANSQLFSWQTYSEDLTTSLEDSAFTTFGLLDQVNVTRDASDYLWYITSVDVGPSESFLGGRGWPKLLVQSTGHALHVFINGQLSGPVVLYGLDHGKRDLTHARWSYQVGLKGEAMDVASTNGMSSVEWVQGSLIAQKNQPLTWHKAYFNEPNGNEPLALDMHSMGKGQVWVNGQSIGRYWTAYATGDCKRCHYNGYYRPTKCQVGCGRPTQRWYHVPRSWLKPTGNTLVLFEELGGDPTRISLTKRSMTSVCADMVEYHPNTKDWHTVSYGKTQVVHRPKIHLQCNPGLLISAIKFASFGTPIGTCGAFHRGTCHARASYGVVSKRCIGKEKCAVTISNSNFGSDPCPNTLKRLTVEAVCAPTSRGITSTYVRKAAPSIEIPKKYFPPPRGYNAPQQVHITQGDYTGRSMIVSWVTPLEEQPKYVTYWEADDENGTTRSRSRSRTTTYRYYNYSSDYIHHATIKRLKYNTKYMYELGKGNGTRRFWFTTPPESGPDVPYTFGIIGDLGQTRASNETLEHYLTSGKGQTVLFLGDFSYADVHPFHDNEKWDTFGRFIEKSSAYEPWIYVAGNHELDLAPEIERVSNIKYNITEGVSKPVKDPSAPVYITVGDGGNIEGIADSFIARQPSYSAFREASFGHALLEIKNRTHAFYTWHRNQDKVAVAGDSIWFYNRYWFPEEEESS
ncbi:hypothetical protein SSX86_019206 [Deinandra increscens subsp. villosa]|uniref:Purple acid phosphatase n=1 Tax=Deinandra increscens subsp. villosa TaxID=3103831 RepID=A0AAP0GVH8_9ASTR